ncbi:MAG: hypothetical protein ACI93R_000359 [Flavobacteriales bacterium]|jgi:hypothetical protein
MIIEHVDRAGHVLERFNYQVNRLSIGRAYDNDLIISDPYVDPHHMEIRFHEDSEVFSLSDLDSRNGYKLHAKKNIKAYTGATLNLSSGDTFTIGKSRYRVLKENHPVKAALPLSLLDSFQFVLGSWVSFIIALSLILTTAGYLQAYLNKPYSDELYKDALQSAYFIIFILIYGLFWSFIARIQRHEGHFLLHCNTLILAALAIELGVLWLPIISFNFSAILFGGLLGTALIGLCIFLLVYISSYYSTGLNIKYRLIFSSALPLIYWLSTGISALNEAEFSNTPAYDMIIVSQKFQWKSPNSDADFLKSTQNLYQPPSEDAVERYLR